MKILVVAIILETITADNSDLLSLSSTCKEVQTFCYVMNQLSIVQTKLALNQILYGFEI